MTGQEGVPYILIRPIFLTAIDGFLFLFLSILPHFLVFGHNPAPAYLTGLLHLVFMLRS